MSGTVSLEVSWADQLYDALRELEVRIFAFVPDAGHKIMINRSLADPDAIAVRLTTEEEGVALLAGAHLGGERGVLLVQSSGVGNCINMLSLTENGRFPLVMMVSMRGGFGEQNPWQVPMGRGTRPCLEAMGAHCFQVDSPEEVVPAARAAFGMAYRSSQSVAILLTQKLLGAKSF